MASVLEPEVQLAQRLASNERPVRTKAIKKLRKYISVRTQAEAGGFSGDELLKLWKGLFYCLWMQDKPLLQAELSNRISTLIHSFHRIDGQLLYLESFLQTFKREWTGIDRLRMDKFLQLIRFMFRQMFEMLQRKDWESSAISRFMEVLSQHVLQSGTETPSGLQLHILDVYLTELAAVGSEQLTADQNLTFIEPFCRAAAKTRNQALFGAICSSIFRTIIDQAPFAIKDLMKEMEADEAMDSDSGRASEDDDKEEEEKSRSRASNRKDKRINGKTSHREEEDDDDDDELLHLEDSDTELPDDDDDDVGPVLQFDYGALADKLLEFASRTSTPGRNRQKLYKIIKVLRDLCEGIFPQDDFPEEVSTDEDDDMFGSRKRMKRRRQTEDENAPTGKKSKANSEKKENLNNQNQSTEPADLPVNKSKKKKKKAKETPENLDQTGSTQDVGEEVHPQISTSSVDETEADDPSKTQLPVRTTEDRTTEDKPKKKRKRKTKTKGSTSESEVPVEEQLEISCEGDAPVMKEPGADVSAVSCEASQVHPGAPVESEETADDATSSAEVCSGEPGPAAGLEKMSDDTGSGEDASKKKKRRKRKKSVMAEEEQTAESEPAEEAVGCSHAEITSGTLQQTSEAKSEETAQKDSSDPDPSALTPMKKRKKKKLKNEAEITKATPTKKMLTDQLKEIGDETPSFQSETLLPSGKPAKKKKKKRKIPVEFEFEADELEDVTLTNGATEETQPADDVSKPSIPLSSRALQKKRRSGGPEFVSFQNKAVVPTPLFCRTKGGPGSSAHSTEKNQTPRADLKKVTFGLKNNKTAEFRRTDRSLLLSPVGSSRVPFDPQQKPKFGVLKSPPNSRPTVMRKTPIGRKKTSAGGANSGRKQRPQAVDFF